ncbi:hypothetical protein K491DRAFT_784486 [Lophiostoma macrostomum CBS 122681]|uniref:Uncharacterized protein n=1 Tax=Lophiostoma macrostomum CBS 122681 TaxID=1314788 RepID=A0A6A6SLI0_9PLEO|nr:hypothetical protein K491DRAFT_784486 [Lophiostoma macrostomum CBS 122681]
MAGDQKKRSADADVDSSPSKRIRTAVDELDTERAGWMMEKARMQGQLSRLQGERDVARQYLVQIKERDLEMSDDFGLHWPGLNKLDITNSIKKLKADKLELNNEMKALEFDFKWLVRDSKEKDEKIKNLYTALKGLHVALDSVGNIVNDKEFAEY